MTEPSPPDDAPALTLFPTCSQLARLVRGETLGLSEEQLNWTSDRWEWSRWSIRQLVSHMASLIYLWLLERWGPQLFPEGTGVAAPDYQTLLSVEHGTTLDDRVFREMADIERAFEAAVYLAVQVLRRETVASVRRRTLTVRLSSAWEQRSQAHATGLRRVDEQGNWEISLEATFRHLHYEVIAHVNDIQRNKRAQGEIAVCELPEEGYILLPDRYQTAHDLQSDL